MGAGLSPIRTETPINLPAGHPDTPCRSMTPQNTSELLSTQTKYSEVLSPQHYKHRFQPEQSKERERKERGHISLSGMHFKIRGLLSDIT